MTGPRRRAVESPNTAPAGRGLDIELEADGGIHPETTPLAVRAGARVLVAGSAIFNRALSVARAMEALRRSVEP